MTRLWREVHPTFEKEQSKKTKIRILIKYLALLCMLAALGSAAACTMPFKIVPNTQPEEGPPPGEEPFPPGEEPPQGEEFPPGEEPPGEGDVWIEFEVERTHLSPGECTMLWWHVEGVDDVSLNREPVERMGEREICLEEPELFVLEAGMERREIEIMAEGMPGEEPPPGDEPPEGEPPPEEPPPSGSEMNDEEAIKQALLANLGWSESELEFSIGRNDGNFAEGGVNKANEMGGAAWLAAKDNNGQWVIVHTGQDLPLCSDIQPYNFPPEWVPYCWDEASGTSIER